ncbi:hypothetical protein BTJ68_11645 [Hortaea werneckii EXF-2000]|uniref:Uncharacterized protein n=1 Tax=Hortaea werneckii EXF-2000 TaxID=1157616 RepID=A0A1Z5SV65_HORWE|nr:hypothetical protein BTJ68_11645 [Hortaea werneckii EXF-2000]
MLIDAQQKANSIAVQAMAGPTLQQPSDLSSYHPSSSTDQKGMDIPNRSESTSMPKTGGRRYRFDVSPWLLQCAWMLTAQRAYSGWDFSFRCYGKLPRDHPAAIACLEGDCAKMQSLLDASQVSPHDEVQGESLAQLAAFAGHLPMIRLLRSVKADMRINSRDSAEGCRELGPCLDIVKPALTDPTYFTTEIGIWHRPYLLHLLAQALGKDCCTDEATYTGRLDALLRAGVSAVGNLHTLDRLGSGMTL